MYWALIALSFATVALAEEPATVLEPDGTVEVRMKVEANAEEILTLLADTNGIYSRLNTDIYETASKKKGLCEEVDRRTKGVWRPFNFRSLRCPTKRGFTETLLSSTDFSQYDSTWEVIDTEAGTEIIYRVRTELNSSLPRHLVQKGTLAGAKETMINLARALADIRSKND